VRLLVTGGAGFIGSHFVRTVLDGRLPGLAGSTVTVLDAPTRRSSRRPCPVMTWW